MEPYLDYVFLAVLLTTFGIVAAYLRQPTLIGYLFAGIMAGPAFLGFMEPDHVTEIIGELGLALLLFLIGLELKLSEFEEILKSLSIISLGLMASVLALSTFTGILLGFELFTSFLIGLGFMYSSTAIVTKLLSDLNCVSTVYGKLNTGNLLIQDLAVVLLMVLVLSVTGDQSIFQSLLNAAIFLLLAIPAALILSRFLSGLLDFIANRELNLFIAGLAWLSLFLIASEYAGMGVEIGAFIAGLGLGQLNYSEELRYDFRPLTDLFVAIFFVNFGLIVSSGELLNLWKEALVFSTVLVLTKFAALYLLTRWRGFDKRASFASGITMTQTSEFSLILGSSMLAAGLMSSDILVLFTLVAVITMSFSSYLIMFHRKIMLLVFGEEHAKNSRKSLAVILGYRKELEESINYLADRYDEVIVIQEDDTNLSLEKASVVFGSPFHEDLRLQEGLKEADVVMVDVKDETLHREVIEEVEGARVILNSKKRYENTYIYNEKELVGKNLAKKVLEAI